VGGDEDKIACSMLARNGRVSLTSTPQPRAPSPPPHSTAQQDLLLPAAPTVNHHCTGQLPPPALGLLLPSGA